MTAISFFRPIAGAVALCLTFAASSNAQEDIPDPSPLAAFSTGFDTIPVATVSDDKVTDLYDADQWIVFGNVFDSTRTNYLYGYGSFFAPNNAAGGGTGPAFSTVGDEVPTTSGDRYLNVFNDYNNAGAHDAGDQINALVFKQYEVTAANVGETWSLNFDYRNATDGNGVADDTTGISEANAFVKVLKRSDSSFAELAGDRLFTTEATDTFTAGSVEIEITAEHVGELFQVGFENFSASYSPTGVYYDSLVLSNGASVLGDFDGDGDVDNLDIDAYSGNLGLAATGELAELDLNDDNQVTQADYIQHVTQLVTAGGIAGTSLGDANLDGVVDVLGDAAALVNNLGLSSRGWADGDFNADGLVDVLGDAAILVDNLGASNSAGGAVAASAVPEPGTISLLGLAVTALAVRRRR